MTRGHGAASRPARRLVIDWALVEQRRVAAGMSHAQLAQRVGVAAVTGPVRLWGDRDHDTVRLGLLERLCQVLDLHPVELFTAPTRVRQRRAVRPAHRPADDQVLEAALATSGAAPTVAAGQHPAPVGRAELADALGWPLHRLAAAVAALEDTLAARGVRINNDVVGDGRTVHDLQPRSGLLTPTQREALHRLAHADERLDLDALRALYAIAQPDSHYTERHHVIGPAGIRLQQLGLVHRRHRSRNLECGATVERQCFGATRMAELLARCENSNAAAAPN
ncbi:helix-turn-helix domain-containing protein [Pseudonocardia hydrocarbonoxydans]|uniref:helix-turn-helix domain-containing protein n=1 Tax=Pseudonocardia hydrocarbonoxydans TaxID=76726 RepID=UPI001144B996|nr:helix-turn-helix transcriptional regulator [Pseudonocardia hydrocarbonoxydans]